jgi:hypothetical protein
LDHQEDDMESDENTSFRMDDPEALAQLANALLGHEEFQTRLREFIFGELQRALRSELEAW